MVSDSKLANAVGGKTARACDNCIRKRARWYCAADDAFLCESCDVSVHSANTLAQRHERVRLKTASIMEPPKEEPSSLEEGYVPKWHHGFTRKARTPRHNNKHSKVNPLHLVPEIGSEENSNEENEEQLLYRVPILDPFVAELCTSTTSNEAINTINTDTDINGTSENIRVIPDINQLHGSLPSEMDLEQFAADVETLLGKGLDDESFDMEGLMDCKENVLMECSMGTSGKVKVEDVEEGEFVITQDFDFEIDITREPFELNFGDNSLETFEEYGVKFQDEKLVIKGGEDCEDDDVKKNERKNLLRLDYDRVVLAWADQRCPWTNGERPEIDSFMCWPYCMGTCGKVHHYEDISTMRNGPTMDGGREARVSRYREKRRTRLFSKKIRYEVRKLNAEKRPRMKGRFVKRSNFAASTFPLLSK